MIVINLWFIVGFIFAICGLIAYFGWPLLFNWKIRQLQKNK